MLQASQGSQENLNQLVYSPLFPALIRLTNPDTNISVLTNVIQILGNIAAHSAEFARIIYQTGVLQSIVTLIKTSMLSQTGTKSFTENIHRSLLLHDSPYAEKEEEEEEESSNSEQDREDDTDNASALPPTQRDLNAVDSRTKKHKKHSSKTLPPNTNQTAENYSLFASTNPYMTETFTLLMPNYLQSYELWRNSMFLVSTLCSLLNNPTDADFDQSPLETITVTEANYVLENNTSGNNSQSDQPNHFAPPKQMVLCMDGTDEIDSDDDETESSDSETQNNPSKTKTNRVLSKTEIQKYTYYLIAPQLRRKFLIQIQDLLLPALLILIDGVPDVVQLNQCALCHMQIRFYQKLLAGLDSPSAHTLTKEQLKLQEKILLQQVDASKELQKDSYITIIRNKNRDCAHVIETLLANSDDCTEILLSRKISTTLVNGSPDIQNLLAELERLKTEYRELAQNVTAQTQLVSSIGNSNQSQLPSRNSSSTPTAHSEVHTILSELMAQAQQLDSSAASSDTLSNRIPFVTPSEDASHYTQKFQFLCQNPSPKPHMRLLPVTALLLGIRCSDGLVQYMLLNAFSFFCIALNDETINVCVFFLSIIRFHLYLFFFYVSVLVYNLMVSLNYLFLHNTFIILFFSRLTFHPISLFFFPDYS